MKKRVGKQAAQFRRRMKKLRKKIEREQAKSR